MSMRHVRPAARHEDYGFFGPDFRHRAGLALPDVGDGRFQRAVVIEELDPALIAAVDKTNAVRSRPRSRYDRTLWLLRPGRVR